MLSPLSTPRHLSSITTERRLKKLWNSFKSIYWKKSQPPPVSWPLSQHVCISGTLSRSIKHDWWKRFAKMFEQKPPAKKTPKSLSSIVTVPWCARRRSRSRRQSGEFKSHSRHFCWRNLQSAIKEWLIPSQKSLWLYSTPHSGSPQNAVGVQDVVFCTMTGSDDLDC